MVRRAQQGSVAHCPYCEAFLPQVAAECPECRFPLTMAAADFGFRAPDSSGTTSTATPSGRLAQPVVPGRSGAAERARFHGTVSRIRITAWLLAVTTILLLLAGVGALFTAASPAAASDARTKANLFTASQRSARPPSQRQLAVTTLGPHEPSGAADQVSVDHADGIWFGVARSASGRCFVLAVRLADQEQLTQGTLESSEPCTGAHLRARFGEKLAKDPG